MKCCLCRKETKQGYRAYTISGKETEAVEVCEDCCIRETERCEVCKRWSATGVTVK